MSQKNRSASLEARLKNNLNLVISLKEYTLYNPTSEDIKAGTYESFVNLVDEAITPYKTSNGAVTQTKKTANDVFTKLNKISRDVRAEIDEVKGKESSEWKQTDNIVKLITGENVKIHSKAVSDAVKQRKDGDPEIQSISVSQTDHKSKLGNFRSLTGLIRNYAFYNPSDALISMSSLVALEDEASSALSDAASAETANVRERSKIIHYFDDKGGLNDRARRAKVHVKRKYGFTSPEYKALTNKRY